MDLISLLMLSFLHKKNMPILFFPMEGGL